MTYTTTAASEPTQAVGAPVEQPVRPLPAPHYPQWSHSNEHAAWTERQVRWIVSREVAAERERCAAWVEARRDAFCEEHGSIDPDTGTLEFGRGPHAEAKSEYVGELEEIAAGLRALRA